MAGDWIKMRAGILQSPRLIGMARVLHGRRDFREWLTPGDPALRNSNAKVTDTALLISDGALRGVTVALLLSVWSAAREFGKFDGDDLVLLHMGVDDIDSMAGAPGVGQAMLAVDWLKELPNERHGVILPKFKQHNIPMTNAERQAEHRGRSRNADFGDPESQNSNALSRNSNAIVTDDRNTDVTNRVTTEQYRTEEYVCNDADAKTRRAALAASAFDEISEEDFRSPVRMWEWFHRHRKPLGFAPDDLLRVFAMGVRVSRPGVAKNPIAMFRVNLLRRLWSFLKKDDRADAKAMLDVVEAKHGRNAASH